MKKTTLASFCSALGCGFCLMVVQKQGSAASEGSVVSNPHRAAVLALTAKPRSSASGALVPCSCLI